MRNEEKCGGFLLSSPEPPKEVSRSITQRTDGLETNVGMKLIVNSYGGMAGEVLLKHLGPVVQKPLTWGQKLTEVSVSLVKKRIHG